MYYNIFNYCINVYLPKYPSDVYKLFVLNKNFCIMNIFNGFFILIYLIYNFIYITHIEHHRKNIE